MRGRAERLGGLPHARRVEIGDMDARAGVAERLRDGAADALGRARDDHGAGVKSELHALRSSLKVSSDCGRRPSSTSWIRPTRRSSAGVGMPFSRASAPMTPIWASISVRRLRTARSRQMPEWVFADCAVYSASQAIASSASASGAPGANASGSEGAEAARRHPAGVCDRGDLAPDREPGRGARRVGEVAGHRVRRQRGREQHRAVGELAPEIAPDVVGQQRVGLEDPEQPVHLARAVADRAVDLADDDRAAVAVEDPAGAEPVGAEIDEAAHGALGPDTARRSRARSARSGPRARSRRRQDAAPARRAPPRCAAPSRQGRRAGRRPRPRPASPPRSPA